MDPNSVALLAALAGGAGGEAGRQAWAGLSALVRRPFRTSRDADQVPAVSSGEPELARLEETPEDPSRAQAVITALAVRAALDADFHTGLQRWHKQAKLVGAGSEVHNEVSGGTFSGPVVQGRDFSGISFTASPRPPASPGSGTPM